VAGFLSTESLTRDNSFAYTIKMNAVMGMAADAIGLPMSFAIPIIGDISYAIFASALIVGLNLFMKSSIKVAIIWGLLAFFLIGLPAIMGAGIFLGTFLAMYLSPNTFKMFKGFLYD